MLELAGGVGLGVDVGDLLELQRAFLRHRIVQAAAQEQRVLLAREVLRPADQLRLQREHRLQRDRQMAQRLQVGGLLLIAQLALDLRQRQRQQEQPGELGRERLGRGDADLDARAGDIGQLALAHHGAGRHVADGERVRHAQALRVAQRGQRVGGLARLADRHHQRPGVRHRFAVAVFARDLDLGRDLGDGFEPVLGGAAAVVAGAAGQDQDLVDLLEHAVGTVAEQLGHDGLDALERVGQRARLLEDLLLHVVAVGAELDRAAVRLHRLDRALLGAERLACGIADPVAAQLQVDQVAFGQVADLVGHAGQRHRVAGQEIFAVTHAQHQRRARARADHAVGLVLVEDRDRVGTVQARGGRAHGLEQVAVVERVDQMRDHLGVGLALEHIAAALQLGAQLVVVLDDAVVHQRDAAGALLRLLAGAMAEVRVGVVHRRRAMRGPARVRDAGAGGQSVLIDLLLQLGHPSRAARALQAGLCRRLRAIDRRAAVHRNAARVITPVFEPLQALHQHRHDIAPRDGTDDSAHIHS